MHIVVFVTTKNKTEAKKIAKKLLRDKLAACVNIINPIESLYRWQGKVCNDKEALMIIKTRKTLFPKLSKTIKSIHSYKVCEIISLPIVAGVKDYLSWINDSTVKKVSSPVSTNTPSSDRATSTESVTISSPSYVILIYQLTGPTCLQIILQQTVRGSCATNLRPPHSYRKLAIHCFLMPNDS